MPRFDIAGFGNVESTIKPVPANKYRMQITKCEERDSKAGNKYLSWTLTICDGSEFQGRNFFYVTMLAPENALWKLKGMCEAVGKGWDASGLDTDQMLGSEILVHVVLQTNKESGEIENAVKKVSKV